MRGILAAAVLLIVACVLIVLFGGDGSRNVPTPPGDTPPAAPRVEPEPGPLRAEPTGKPEVDEGTETPPIVENVVPDSGSISGVVLRDDTGEPIPGARVVSLERASRSAATDTGDDGRFRLTNLPPGSHVLGVTADGFARGEAKGVEVEAGRETAWIVVRLGVGGTIRGIVYGPDGTPSPGAKVLLVPFLDGVRVLGDFGFEITADETGAYLFEHLTPGKYYVRRPSGGSTPVVLIDDQLSPKEEAEPYLEVGEGDTVTFDLRTDRVGGIRGTARSREGRPVRRQVSLLDAEGVEPARGEPKFALPDEKGEFTLADLPPGEYVLESDGVRTPVTVRAGQITEVEIVFDTGRIEGVVLDETGAPLEGAKVWLHRRNEDSFRVRVEITPAAETDAEGRFEFSEVTAGKYRIQADLTPASAESETVEIQAGEVRKGVVIRLDRPVEVRVVVIDGAGTPVAGIAVQLAAQEGETDADGVAVFKASPGRHPVIAGTPPDAVMRVVLVDRSGSQTFTITKR